MRTDLPGPRISLFGIFGSGNFGNECTLQAMLGNMRRFVPDARLNCICSGAEDTSARYGLPACVIKPALSDRWTGRRGLVTRWVRRIAVGIPMEVYRWLKAIQTMMRTDALVMTGTGMLGDFGIAPFGLHYDILRWSIAAKLCRCRLLFVSVGAGPLERRVSRWFVKAALSLADYRSYRDTFSKDYLKSIGFQRSTDAVYPDLAFSLPGVAGPRAHHKEQRRPVIGLGVMTYYDRRSTLERGEAVYHDYIAKLASFVIWLLEHQYIVRLLIGDATYDDRVIHDLREVLKERGRQDDLDIIDEPMASAEDVLTHLAATDLVVASRFHNVLLALMLNKPVLAISYHEKVDALMAAFGLQKYSQDIEHLDLDRLIGQLTALEAEAAALKPRLQQTAEICRTTLDRQYDRMFNLVIRSTPSSSDRRFVASNTSLSS